jgi:hypothetical protein
MSSPIVKPIKSVATPMLRSPIPPVPPESFRKRFWRKTKFAMVVAFFIFVWAASSLFIAPVVQWTLSQGQKWIERTAALKQEAFLLDTKLSIPCESFETLPPGCGTDEDVGEVRYGTASVLYFFGHLPELNPLTFQERADGLTPDGVLDGAFYTLQKSFGALPVGDAATALAKDEMATYGGYQERTLASDVIAYQASEGSAVRASNFYAVYTRGDGLKIAAACFGEACKVLQAPWRGELAYGFTIDRSKAANLPAIDAAVQARLSGYVVAQ